MRDAMVINVVFASVVQQFLGISISIGHHDVDLIASVVETIVWCPPRQCIK
jgi:hypothetical protein